MARTPEGKVKDKVVAVLKKHGAYYFSPPSNGFGRAGIPDIIACLHGWFIAIECKAGSNKCTPLQLRELDKIDNAEGFAMVVNETNIHLVDDVMQRIKDHHAHENTTLSTTGTTASDVGNSG
jgi:hypothetical protein